ncbi:hypothetical protein B0T18DRAFT_389110 [Schizothecium vesticola]|uniref:Mid2 domain-containing protein n=1 Tax=Schizothecium vesticola TaxID=314040 RepID=A0AA40F1W7_9PEZI|nr:hypothetical protein B0T18DRAFT_389110 [Schizothecium vesticola]
MHFQRLLEILAIGLSAVAVTEATFVDARLAADKGFAIKPRQNTGDTTVATTSSTSSSSTTPPPTTTTTTPPPPDPTTSKTSSSSTSTPGPSQTPTPSVTPPPDSTPKPSEPPLSDVLTTITMIITTTGADGQQTTFTSQQTSTATAALAGKTSSPSGMSPQTRNTVIGVVVGVGGAIILGGLAFVAWRIWGRKKGADENDNLMDYPSGTAEKPATGNTIGGTPFQSTLESYHAPTQVNQAKNF